jgi:MFS family permease
MALGGVVVAPALATVFALIDVVAPDGTATEALTWIISAYMAGLALAAAIAGSLVDDYPKLVLAGGAISAALAAALAGLGLGTLAPNPQLARDGEVHA